MVVGLVWLGYVVGDVGGFCYWCVGWDCVGYCYCVQLGDGVVDDVMGDCQLDCVDFCYCVYGYCGFCQCGCDWVDFKGDDFGMVVVFFGVGWYG